MASFLLQLWSFISLFYLTKCQIIGSINLMFLIDVSGPSNGILTLAAPFVALDKIRSGQSTLFNSINAQLPQPPYNWTDTKCNPRVVIDQMIKERDASGINPHVIIGIGSECSSLLCGPVGLLAGVWNSAFISHGCVSNTMNNPSLYPTFARTVGTADAAAVIFKLIANEYNWITTAIIVSSDTSLQLTANAIRTELAANGKVPTLYTMKNILDSNNKLIQTSLDDLRRNIQNLPQLTRKSKDYYDSLSLYPFHLSGPSITQSLYEGVIAINERRSVSTSEWNNFSGVMKSYPIYKNINYTYPSVKVPWEAGLLHDAVLLWARIASEINSNNEDISNGLLVIEKMSNLTFTGMDNINPITGPIIMDFDDGKKHHVGNRIMNYDISIINNKQFVQLAYFDASSRQLVTINNNGTWLGAGPPLSDPKCSAWNSSAGCPSTMETILVTAIPIGIVVVLAIIVIAVYKKQKGETELYSVAQWKVSWNEIEKNQPNNKPTYGSGDGDSEQASVSAPSQQPFIEIAMCKGKLVAIKMVKRDLTDTKIAKRDTIDTKNRFLLQEVREVRQLSHENVNPFIGACVEPEHVCILMVYAAKGSLHNVLVKEEMKISRDFKISFSVDIANGMHYLHDNLGPHGHLTSNNCLIDSCWQCKVTDYGLLTFRNRAQKFKDMANQSSELLWTAPELLRQPVELWPLSGTKEADIYAYAIVVSEILTRDAPFALVDVNYTAETIIETLRNDKTGLFRPIIPTDMEQGKVEPKWKEMLSKCWNEIPNNRPNFSGVKLMMKMISGKKVNVIDNMIKMLEQHNEHLEELIDSRTRELEEEKKKVENLIYNILPRLVANQLKRGKEVSPETFDAVSIYYSDIVGFTSIAYESTPLQVVTMLNKLYSLFDEIIDKYDAYKVEIIGDAYMVVSGCPGRNEDRHAGEIATMSLHLLSGICSFKIPHLPERDLRLRIGLHTGPVIGGVVGRLMPRYCLFGETVNIASKMESCGAPLKIHMSEATHKVLNKEKDKWFSVLRGEIDIKVKNKISTYWLTGKTGLEMKLPEMIFTADQVPHNN